MVDSKSGQKPFSEQYWEARYKQGGNSGTGSYGRLADFKANTINGFIRENKIRSVIEFGAGDGNQLSLYRIKNYMGFDVSASAIEKLQYKFRRDSSKKFFLVSEYAGQKADLAMSIDVIFHLVEDDVFNDYMARLFQAAGKHVIIYSSNQETQEATVASHFRHRKFTDWIELNRPDWRLTCKLDNLYPYKGGDPDTSTADFYFFSVSC